MLAFWIVIAVVVVALAVVGGVVLSRRRADPHSDVPSGTHSQSRRPPTGAQDTNDPVAPPEAAVDMPSDRPEGAPDIAASEAGIPSPSKSDR